MWFSLKNLCSIILLVFQLFLKIEYSIQSLCKCLVLLNLQIYLLPFLISLGLSSEWGTSISVRTPNDDIHPLDYELSVKLEDTDGKFRYL